MLFHCTAEQRTKLVPVTLMGNAAVPTVAVAGERAVIVGTGSPEGGAEIVNVTGAELTAKLLTVIEAGPARAISGAGILAVSCVELINVVARAEPFQSTTEVFRKFEPFTVRVNPVALQDGVEFDELVEEDKDAMEGGKIANGVTGEAVPPGLITLI